MVFWIYKILDFLVSLIRTYLFYSTLFWGSKREFILIIIEDVGSEMPEEDWCLLSSNLGRNLKKGVRTDNLAHDC